MSDLTDRMRTCAAYFAERINDADPEWAELPIKLRGVRDAADLLIEASNKLEELHSTGALRIPHDLGEPMELIEPGKPAVTVQPDTGLPAGDDWVMRRRRQNPRACPKCDSHAAKTVRRDGRKLMLICPVCAASWQWQPKAEWV